MKSKKRERTQNERQDKKKRKEENNSYITDMKACGISSFKRLIKDVKSSLLNVFHYQSIQTSLIISLCF